MPATDGTNGRFDLRGGLGAEWRLTGRDTLVADVDALYTRYVGEADTTGWEAALDLAGYHRFGEGLFVGGGVRGVMAHVGLFDTDDLRWGEARAVGRAIVDRLTLDLTLGAGLRSFPDRPYYTGMSTTGTPGQSDLTARVRLDARYRPEIGATRFGGGLGYDAISTQRGGVDYDTALVDGWVSHPLGPVRASLSAAAWRRSFDAVPGVRDPRVDLAGAVALFGGYRLWPTVELGARYRYIRSGSDSELGRYAQHFAGVELVAWFAPPAPPPPPPVVGHAPIDTASGWRFSHRAPGAKSVALVGDFNGWAVDAATLDGPDPDGWWTVTLPLDPGRYTYMFVEDGDRFVRPIEAPAYADDGFGGEVGVLFVWQERNTSQTTATDRKTKYRRVDENR